MKQKLLVLVAVGIGLVSTSHLFAQRSEPQEVYKILGISVEGNTLTESSGIISYSGLKIGDEILVPGDQVSQGIRKLWSLKVFDDIQISIDRTVGNGVFLLIKVKELPRYERTEIVGNDDVDEDDIMKKITLIRGQVLQPQELVKIQKDVTALYETEGFLLAKVKVTTEQIDTMKNHVVLKVDVGEGTEVRVGEILFEGNEAFDNGDLRGEMETTTKKWWKFWSGAKFERKKYDEDKKLIVQYYKKNGYRDAEVLGDSIWYTSDKTRMAILLRVYEGPQYKVRNITWEGNTVYPEAALNERLNVRKGEIYNSEKFERNLRGNEQQNDVASLYVDNGYLRFNLEPVETRAAEDSIDIAISVYEYNKYQIGHVNIKGNTKTYEKVIRRELLTKPGEYFSRAAILRSVRELQTLNYFNPEKIKPDYHLVDDKTVDLTYEVEEKSSDNINASVGYSAAFGVSGALGFTINNFSVSEPLAGGGGQILNFEWQFGRYNFRTFTVGFTEPWLLNTPTLLGVSLFDTRQNYTFDLQQTGGSVRIGRRFKWPDPYFRGDWILNAQHNDVRDGRGLYTEGKTSQVSLTQIISRNSVDNPVFPSYGSNVSLSVEIAGGPLLPGTVDFHKWNFQSDWYVPLFNSSRITFYLSSQYGFISPLRDNTVIPPIEMFIMGGTGLGQIATIPLRGYEDQSIGPFNASGTSIVYGRAMAKQTAELRLALAINPIPIYILGFVEGGNVYESMTKANFFDLKRSAGFGARLQINPIGLIGFDYGYGFDDVEPRDGRPDGWHFHFVFGRGF